MLRRLGDGVRQAGSCVFLAGTNLLQHKIRLVVALLGTAVALLLLQLQIAFLDATRTKVTLLYDKFAFDLALVPDAYQFLGSTGTFDRIRLTQARAAAEIAESFSLNVTSGRWTDQATKGRSSLLLIGVDEPGGMVRDAKLAAAIAALRNSRAVLIDAFSSAEFGSLAPGTTAAIADQEVVIAGSFELGLFFYADGGAMVRNVDFARLSGRAARDTSIGLMRLAAGADPIAAKARLAAALPRDVRVYRHDELIAQERAFFLSTKPIGILLRIGMVVAFLVGAVILFQVLSTEIINRTKEFATLKAIGFGPLFVYGIALTQMAMLALGAFLPTVLVGGAILWLVHERTHLPTALTAALGGEVLATAFLMCLVSGLVVMRRIGRADPAELY